MLPGATDPRFAEQLMRIAKDPDLRRSLYERLGDYCHKCRNQLNSLKLSLYLVRRQPSTTRQDLWAEIDGHYQELERRVDLIQTLCRPMALSRVTLGLELLIEDRREPWTRLMAATGRNLELVPPAERAVASFDVQRMGQALDSLVEWRAGEGEANSSARLRWWVDSGRAHLAWEESEPRSTGSADRRIDGTSSWALPLISRVTQAHEGDFRVQDDHEWKLEISWPTQPPQTLA